ncbi:MAG: helix-turn-helix domain-containing protein [Alphaproteobacteria bacterium]|nr:helix-turn-helix domain-containing protein [Alphaproteobacteria bacterium]
MTVTGAPARSGRTVLDQWRFKTADPTAATVLPDGCRDLIVSRRSDGTTAWFVSPLAATAYTVSIAADTAMVGIRLRPGVEIDEAALRRAGPRANGLEPDLDALEAACRLRPSVVEALDCLADDPGDVAAAAGRLGVTIRTLERHLARHTGAPPRFWLGLGRARRAARSVAGQPGRGLSDIAADHGFADQAHMTRALRRWFATTPGRLRRDPDRIALLFASGYGAPETGEQISTSTPLPSAT